MYLIFDLDGTLVDSRSGIIDSLEQAVHQVLPGVNPGSLSFTIGPPVRTMFHQALEGATDRDLDELVSAFRLVYDREGWKQTSLFPGVLETLSVLHAHDIKLCIVTNKPKKPTKKILTALGLSPLFSAVVCPDSHQPNYKEKTESLNYLLSKYSLHGETTVLVGDDLDDLHAAEAFDLPFVGVEFGYGSFRNSSRPVQVVHGFPELLDSVPVRSQVTPASTIRREKMINRDIFDELFVLELANNHWGDVQRGLQIIKEFGTVVRYNNVHAGIKLQLRDVESFIHKDFLKRDDIRYIKKTLDTRMSREDFEKLVEAIRRSGCIRIATPFDEKSVEYCVELGIDIIKVGSSDVTDWPLLEKIARARKPVLVSTGGTSLKDIDDMVTFFDHRTIPLAINHCISIYPTEDADLQLNQIDFLRDRYPGHVIGFSTHEYHDWFSSIMIAYAKGARTFERHIDINRDDKPFSLYCSTPEQIAEWFQAFKRAKEMCGAPGTEKAPSTQKEIDYLTTLVRGVYASRNLSTGHVLTSDDYYLAIPLQKGQLSCRELLNDQILALDVKKDAPLMVDSVDSLYNRDETLRKQLYARGL